MTLMERKLTKLKKHPAATLRHDKYEKYIADFREEFPLHDVPINLKHNTQGANVTDLSYRLDNYIAALMAMPIRPSLDQGSMGTTRLRLAQKKYLKLYLKV
jgi:hypothetical protein